MCLVEITVWLDLGVRGKENLIDWLVAWDTLLEPGRPELGVFSCYKSTSGECFNHSTEVYTMGFVKKDCKANKIRFYVVLKDVLD